MSFLNKLGGGGAQQPARDPGQLTRQLQAQPSAMLAQSGCRLTVPPTMTDGSQILDYWVQSGQVGPQQLQQAKSILGRFQLPRMR